jgi:hypothetical protein
MSTNPDFMAPWHGIARTDIEWYLKNKTFEIYEPNAVGVQS